MITLKENEVVSIEDLKGGKHWFVVQPGRGGYAWLYQVEPHPTERAFVRTDIQMGLNPAHHPYSQYASNDNAYSVATRQESHA